jgi:hypothetical protein
MKILLQIRMVCEPLVLAIVLFQLISELFDISNIGHQRWWRILVGHFPLTSQIYSLPSSDVISHQNLLQGCPAADTRCFSNPIPVRSRRFHAVFGQLLFRALSSVDLRPFSGKIFNLKLFLKLTLQYYCRAVNFVGPFVLMVSYIKPTPLKDTFNHTTSDLQNHHPRPHPLLPHLHYFSHRLLPGLLHCFPLLRACTPGQPAGGQPGRDGQHFEQPVRGTHPPVHHDHRRVPDILQQFEHLPRWPRVGDGVDNTYKLVC